MVQPKKTPIYLALRTCVSIASFFFFKKRDVHFAEPLPKDKKPMIFVGNHQCTFMDPMQIGIGDNYSPSFMTRADAFSNPFLRKFMFAIRLSPIYRLNDGLDFIEKNELVFNNAIEQLEANLQFVIFGEGSHSSERRLRLLKKGFARIGFDALERNNGTLDVQVVPVGVEYWDFVKMHQNLLVSYGKPIALKDYWEDYQENPKKTLITVKNLVYDRLKELVIHITSKKHYTSVENLRLIVRPWLYEQMGVDSSSLFACKNADQKMIDALYDYEQNQAEAMDAFAQRIDAYSNQLEQINFRNKFIINPPTSRLSIVLQLLLMMLFLPIYIIGGITGYLPYIIPVKLGRKLFKDKMFYSSVGMTGGMVVFPVFWLVYTLLTLLITGSGLSTLLIALFLPFSWWFAFRYFMAGKKLWHQWRFINFNHKNAKVIEDLKEQYDAIISEVKTVLNH